MNRSERQTRLYDMRVAISYDPPDSDIRASLVRYYLTYKIRISEAATLHRQEFIDQLGQLRDMIIQQTKRPPSRLMICATALENSVQMPIEDLSFHHYADNQLPEFAFWSDIAQGINMVKVPLILGEEYIREHAEKAIQESRQELEEYTGELTPSQAAESYLRLQSEAQEAAGLLMADPSGLTLVRAAVEQVIEPPKPGKFHRIFPSNRIRAYVIAGAELGQFAYEIMYPLTEKLPPINK